MKYYFYTHCSLGGGGGGRACLVGNLETAQTLVVVRSG